MAVGAAQAGRAFPAEEAAGREQGGVGALGQESGAF